MATRTVRNSKTSSNTSTKPDVYQDVTDRIIAELAAGTAPWVKPWATTGSHTPHNAHTGRQYNGVNVLLLWMAAASKGYTSQAWLTFKQAQELGGHVKKGEHGEHVVFWKFLDKTEKDAATGEESKVTIPMARLYTVFNVEQCEGLKLPARETVELTEHERHAAAEALIAASCARVIHGGERACYIPSRDEVHMPELGTFIDASGYYATMLHELTHWTGHSSRCGRDLSGRFGGESYAAEELIAELGAAFLCGELGIQGELRHAGYIQSWLRVLKQDKRAVFTAASMATKAATYLKGLQGDAGDLGDSVEVDQLEQAA
jgi:antirestriction protein ArdC